MTRGWTIPVSERVGQQTEDPMRRRPRQSPLILACDPTHYQKGAVRDSSLKRIERITQSLGVVRVLDSRTGR